MKRKILNDRVIEAMAKQITIKTVASYLSIKLDQLLPTHLAVSVGYEADCFYPTNHVTYHQGNMVSPIPKQTCQNNRHIYIEGEPHY